MALSRILLESGDRLLTEDGAGFVTEDSVDERLASLDAGIGEVAVAASGALALAASTTASIGEILLSAAGALQQQGAGVVIVTLDPITAVGTGALAIAGALSASIGEIGLAATGETTLPEGTGSLSINIEPITILSGGALDIAGGVDASIGSITLAAAGTGSGGREGAVAVSIGAILLAATGMLGAAPSGPITLAEARRQCRLDDDTEDAALSIYMAAAVDWVTEQTGLDPLEAPWPPLLKVAALLLVGEFYGAREVGTLSPEVERVAISLIRSKRPLTG